MDTVLWMLAGGALGWVSHSLMGFNEQRGRVVSIVIGALGGALGGKEISPLFTHAVAGEFNLAAMMFALAVAAAFLAISQLVTTHWGV